MKAKTFENLIRKVVREEIDYALRREIKSLKEDLRSELKPIVTEHTERLIEVPDNPVPESLKSSLREKIMGKQSFTPQNFVGDSTLNTLLNETAMGDTSLESTLPEQPMPSSVANVVNRDYSALMKAIDKKKGL